MTLRPTRNNFENVVGDALSCVVIGGRTSASAATVSSQLNAASAGTARSSRSSARARSKTASVRSNPLSVPCSRSSPSRQAPNSASDRSA
jgi:hypothetical protein